jgi:hypothetical protein
MNFARAPRAFGLVSLVLLFVVTPITNASAEVYLCNGTYSSSPCGDHTPVLNLKPLSKMGRSATETPVRSEEAAAAVDDSAEQAAATSADKPSSGTFTRLRVMSNPVWTLTLGDAYTRVSGGEAIIKNVGLTAAQNISVNVSIPGKTSASVRMDGPQSLAAGESAAYVLKEESVIKRGAPINIKIVCDNCWR